MAKFYWTHSSDDGRTFYLKAHSTRDDMMADYARLRVAATARRIGYSIRKATGTEVSHALQQDGRQVVFLGVTAR